MGVYGEVYEKGIVGKEGKGSAVGEGVALTCLLSFAPFDGVSVTALDVIYNSSSSTSRSSGSYSSYSSSIVDYTVLFGSETGAIRVFSLRAKRSARPSNDCNESIGDIGGIGGIGGVGATTSIAHSLPYNVYSADAPLLELIKTHNYSYNLLQQRGGGGGGAGVGGER